MSGTEKVHIVETTVANGDGGFTLGQVLPNGHYNHYLHNVYVAFLQGVIPNYQISLGVAKMTYQLPGYTCVSGLERSKLKQMTLQYIQNAGEDGARGYT